MAVVDPRDAVLRRIKDILRCGVCVEVLRDARVLPCGHSFCRSCLELIRRHRSAFFGMSCPICRKSSFGGLSDLPRNFMAQDMTEVVRPQTESQVTAEGVGTAANQFGNGEDGPEEEIDMQLLHQIRVIVGLISVFVIIVVFGVAVFNGWHAPTEERKNAATQSGSTTESPVSCQRIRITSDHLWCVNEEKQKSLLSQLTDYFKQIYEKIFAPKEEKKPQTFLERLKDYFWGPKKEEKKDEKKPGTFFEKLKNFFKSFWAADDENARESHA